MMKGAGKIKEIEKAIMMLVDCVRQGCSNPKPVIFHSLRVGFKLYELNQTKEVIIAGLLHDLIEDTDCTLNQIKKAFGPKVVNLVSACTFDRSIKDYKKRWHKGVEQIKKAGKQAMLIKIIDASDNLPYYFLSPKDPKRQREGIWKHRLLVKSFKSEMREIKVFKEYKQELERQKYLNETDKFYEDKLDREAI